MALPAVFFAVLYLVYRRLPLPLPLPQPAMPAGPAAAGRTARLPVTCGLLALLVAVGIGIEFCVVYFGAELLSAGAGLSTTAAATSMAVFYAGIFAARVGAGVFIRRPGQGAGLFWASLAVTAAGFGAFWLSRNAVIALPGLFITGAGVANLFPLSLALTLAAAPGRTDVANARTQLLGGLVVIAAPFLLGSLADHLGLYAAFGIVPVLIAISAGLLLSGLLSAARRPACRPVAPGTRPVRHNRVG